MHVSVCGHINVHTYLCVLILCEYVHMGECVHYVCTCDYVSLLCVCMIPCICVCMRVYVAMCVRMYMFLWQEADSSAVTAGLTCGLLQGDK